MHQRRVDTRTVQFQSVVVAPKRAGADGYPAPPSLSHSSAASRVVRRPTCLMWPFGHFR